MNVTDEDEAASLTSNGDIQSILVTGEAGAGFLVGNQDIDGDVSLTPLIRINGLGRKHAGEACIRVFLELCVEQNGVTGIGRDYDNPGRIDTRGLDEALK